MFLPRYFVICCVIHAVIVGSKLTALFLRVCGRYGSTSIPIFVENDGGCCVSCSYADRVVLPNTDEICAVL